MIPSHDYSHTRLFDEMAAQFGIGETAPDLDLFVATSILQPSSNGGITKGNELRAVYWPARDLRLIYTWPPGDAGPTLKDIAPNLTTGFSRNTLNTLLWLAGQSKRAKTASAV